MNEVTPESRAIAGASAWSCPTHGAVLRPEGGSLPFLSCPEGHAFPIVNGIPRFVAGSTYADAFGAQWNRYRLTQLDSYTKTTITRDRLRRCLGDALVDSLEGLRVLECGCGAGRFTEVLLDRGAAVTSVDLSEAVDANAENFPLSDRHRVAQADILALPFAPRQFDVVLCLGVVQHTPSPERTIEALAGHVRPGGWLVIDHYTHNLSWYTKTAPLFRKVLRRLSPATGLRVTEWLVARLLPLHARAARNRVAYALLTRLSPVLAYYRAFPQLEGRLHREWALLDTHDSLTDWFKHFRTRRQIESTLRLLGFEQIWCEKGGNGIEARAKRPERT